METTRKAKESSVRYVAEKANDRTVKDSLCYGRVTECLKCENFQDSSCHWGDEAYRRMCEDGSKDWWTHTADQLRNRAKKENEKGSAEVAKDVVKCAQCGVELRSEEVGKIVYGRMNFCTEGCKRVKVEAMQQKIKDGIKEKKDQQAAKQEMRKYAGRLVMTSAKGKLVTLRVGDGGLYIGLNGIDWHLDNKEQLPEIVADLQAMVEVL